MTLIYLVSLLRVHLKMLVFHEQSFGVLYAFHGVLLCIYSAILELTLTIILANEGD